MPSSSQSVGKQIDSNTDTEIPAAFNEYTAESLPNATPRGHGKDGSLFARFAHTGSQTRLIRDRFTVPLHLTGTLDHDPLGPTACIQEPTGGVTHGDRHDITVEAVNGATAVVTTQSATKVHSMHSDYAHLDTTITVDNQSYLEFLPGPVIVNEDARLLQTTDIKLAPTGMLLTTDIFAPSGLSQHTPFSFDHYHSRFRAYRDTDMIYMDTVDLPPEADMKRPPAQFGSEDIIGTLWIFTPDPLSQSPLVSDQCEYTLDDLIEHLRGCAQSVITEQSTLTAGITRLPNDAGVCLRGIGETTDQLQTLFNAVRDAFRQVAFGCSISTDRWY